MSGRAKSLVAPIALPADERDDEGRRLLHVIVETARGGRNKMAYDEQQGLYRLKKVLPEGMSFPVDFGFVPSTRGDDGDPLDALVLMDEPGTTGCLVTCRLVGVILGEQEEDGETFRNDRLLAVAMPSHTHGDIKHVDDLNRTLLTEIEKFFVNYHAESGAKFKVLGCKGPKRAWKLVDEGKKKAA